MARTYECFAAEPSSPSGAGRNPGAVFLLPPSLLLRPGALRSIFIWRIVVGNHCFRVWDFHFRLRCTQPTVEQTVRGGSHLVLDADGRILRHSDYGDAAVEGYEKLPALGAQMR